MEVEEVDWGMGLGMNPTKDGLCGRDNSFGNNFSGRQLRMSQESSGHSTSFKTSERH